MAAGAQMVKIEGGAEMAETTHFLTSRGIPVCAHVGLTPQSVHQLGGYRVQGKDDAGAAKLKADALAQQEAGATLMVLEAIPAWRLKSRRCCRSSPSALAPRRNAPARCWYCTTCSTSPRPQGAFREELHGAGASVAAAIAAYVAAVKRRQLPAPEHCY